MGTGLKDSHPISFKSAEPGVKMLLGHVCTELYRFRHDIEEAPARHWPRAYEQPPGYNGAALSAGSLLGWNPILRFGRDITCPEIGFKLSSRRVCSEFVPVLLVFPYREEDRKSQRGKRPG